MNAPRPQLRPRPRPRPRPWHRTAPRRRFLPRPRLPEARRARALCAALGAVAVVVALAWLWNGTPYPKADPDRTAVRLKGQAQLAYDEAALPGRPEVGPVRVETGTCYYRGLRSVAHIDQGRGDVRRFGLDWRVTGVPEDVARSGLSRTRARLEREGWTFVESRVDRPGFRFRNPDNEDLVYAHWYRETGTYAVSTAADCGKLPDDFDEYAWPEADWSPTSTS